MESALFNFQSQMSGEKFQKKVFRIKKIIHSNSDLHSVATFHPQTKDGARRVYNRFAQIRKS